jgi:hypothetical protein
MSLKKPEASKLSTPNIIEKEMLDSMTIVKVNPTTTVVSEENRKRWAFCLGDPLGAQRFYRCAP